MIPDLNVNKHRKSTTLGQHILQRQEDILSLVFKKLNLCPVMPASRGVNQLATSHTVEHLSSLCLQSWSHDKPILYLIYLCSAIYGQKKTVKLHSIRALLLFT